MPVLEPSRNKKRDKKAGVCPLSNGSELLRFMAYQKQVHKFSKKHYHLNFYEVIILSIVSCINAEEGNKGASMQDITHYMSWDESRRGRFFLARLCLEGWLIDLNALTGHTPHKYKLVLSLKCTEAMKAIERHCEVLLSAKPPKRVGKYVSPRKPGNSGLLTGYLRGKKKPKGFDDGIEFVGHS